MLRMGIITPSNCLTVINTNLHAFYAKLLLAYKTYENYER